MKLLFAGDFCPFSEQSKRLLKDHRFEEITGQIKPFVDNADFSIINFESPIIHPKCKKPVFDGIVQLGCSTDALECVKYTGFKMVALANNHLHDYGDDSVLYTIESIHNNGLPYSGAGKTIQDASAVTYYDNDGVRIGVVNFCENEFSVATKTTAGAYPMDFIRNYKSIVEAKQNADIVVVFVHGGVEHYQLPTPQMKKRYHFYIDLGADVVINSHQHCYSGYEIYNNKTIVYGLGNFFFDRDGYNNNTWCQGYIAIVSIEKQTQEITIIPYEQGGGRKGVYPLKDNKCFFDHIEQLNSIIANDSLLEKEYDQYVTKHIPQTLYTFLPTKCNVFAKLYLRGMIKNPYNRMGLVKLLNYIRCESHREKVIRSISILLDLPRYE